MNECTVYYSLPTTLQSSHPFFFPILLCFSLILYQVLSEQMATSLTGVLDRINSQWFRISQRLQWAAGSTSSLNATIDEFERAMNRRKLILQVMHVH